MSAHYFVSDAHIGAGRADAEQRLGRFLENIKGRADSLYILGDLFEFWFEYRRAVPKQGFGVLSRLAELNRSGTKITYLKGNHDFWFQDFLRRELHAETADELDVVIDGRRVFVAHGDRLDRSLVARFFRWLMRSRVNGALYSMLHPDLGIGLARWVALANRDEKTNLRLKDAMARFAEERLRAGYDIVVLGHSHAPERREWDNGIYLNVGDWMTHFTYGVIRDGAASLHVFEGQLECPV